MKSDKMSFTQYLKFWLKIHFEDIRQPADQDRYADAQGFHSISRVAG